MSWSSAATLLLPNIRLSEITLCENFAHGVTLCILLNVIFCVCSCKMHPMETNKIHNLRLVFRLLVCDRSTQPTQTNGWSTITISNKLILHIIHFWSLNYKQFHSVRSTFYQFEDAFGAPQSTPRGRSSSVPFFLLLTFSGNENHWISSQSN